MNGPDTTADRQIVITRLFNAPRTIVFQAFTDPKHVDHWWGPRGFKTETADMDVSTGAVEGGHQTLERLAEWLAAGHA